MDDLKNIIADNLVKFRKNAKLTQLELAEKLKYSDKNVSKWERGESMPDVVVLKQLADLYSVKVDDFFVENSSFSLPNNSAITKENKSRTLNKKQLLIILLSISLVWLTAIVLFCVFINVQMFSNSAWLCFIYAITISCIIAVIFTSLWCTNLLNAITVSLLIWSSGLSIFLSVPFPESWSIFLVCIPLQLLDILWFSFRKVSKNLKNEKYIMAKENKKEEKKLLKEEKKRNKQQKKQEKIKAKNKE